MAGDCSLLVYLEQKTVREENRKESEKGRDRVIACSSNGNTFVIFCNLL
jgi:hypothetical protein